MRAWSRRPLWTILLTVLVALPVVLLSPMAGGRLLANTTGAGAPPGTLDLVSLRHDLGQPSGDSFDGSASVDGRKFAFVSAADDLLPGILTNLIENVYVRDTQSGQIELASHPVVDGIANGPSLAPSLSADGHVVAFMSFASNLVEEDFNTGCGTLPPGATGTAPTQLLNCSDIFLYDGIQGTLELLSVASDGSQGNLESGYPSISADGRRVVFESLSDNLVEGDTNATWDIFLRDRDAQSTTRLSLDPTGEQLYGESRLPRISPDGRTVAFYSNAPNLAPGTPGGTWQVIVREIESGATTIASVSSGGSIGNADSGGAPDLGLDRAPALSYDGRIVAFHSYATNLVAGDNNGQKDVFVHDLNSQQTWLASLSARGDRGNGPSYGPALSWDGDLVAFESQATNLALEGAPAPNGTAFVYWHDRVSGQTGLASAAFDGSLPGASSHRPLVAGNGLWLGFDSMEALTGGDQNGYSDLYARPVAGQITGFFALPAAGRQQAEGGVGRVFATGAQGQLVSGPILAGGTFALLLPAGEWTLTYTFPNHPDWYGPPLNGGAPVTLAPEQIVALPTVPISTGDPFSAMIFDPGGMPLTGAELRVSSQLDDGTHQSRVFHYDALAGHWPFFVPCGQHALDVQARAVPPGWVPPARLTFTSCQAGAPTTFALHYEPAPLAVRGAVTVDLGGNPLPVAGAYVWARRPNGGHRQVLTGPDGRYAMQVGPGLWELRALYEAPDGSRYASSIAVYAVEPGEDGAIEIDFLLEPTAEEPLPPAQSFDVPADEDAFLTFSDPVSGLPLLDLFVPAGTFGLPAGEMATLVLVPEDAALPRTGYGDPSGPGFSIDAYDGGGQLIPGPFLNEVVLGFPVEAAALTNPAAERVLFYSDEYGDYVPLEAHLLDLTMGRLYGFTDHFSRWVRMGFGPMEDGLTSITADSDSPGAAGVPVAFIAAVEPAGTQGVVYHWEFGDGTQGSGPTPFHVYTAAGQYTVTVTAVNATSSVSDTISVEITAPPLRSIFLPLTIR